MPKRIIFNLPLSPGDTIALTPALRDLHLAYPDEFVTDFRGTAEDLLIHNPNITRMGDGEGMHVRLHYPLISQANSIPIHFTQAYHEYLARGLGMPIPYTSPWPEIFVAPHVQNPLAGEGDYWVVVSGGKTDFTNKWPYTPNLKHAVRTLQRKGFCFVQVGDTTSTDHYHPSLGCQYDLRGKTTLSRLARLVEGAAGVLCPNTMLMHMAAAFKKPCVVMAGGREPIAWFQYPNHQVLHTMGQLPCCAAKGCWKSRYQKLGDGSEQDTSLCDNPTKDESGEDIKRALCQKLITSDQIVRAVEGYSIYEEITVTP